MSQNIFIDLLELLFTSHALHGSSRTSTREVLGIILFILSHNESIRVTSEQFQHSTKTICRYFDIRLNALLSLSTSIVMHIDPNFREISNEIMSDRRYILYFKVCKLAIRLYMLCELYNNYEKKFNIALALWMVHVSTHV